jgi:acetylornithine deacetylase/succinyl-diaminopimelate desuccinylase-like protein
VSEGILCSERAQTQSRNKPSNFWRRCLRIFQMSWARDSPPFEPVLKNGYVFARGATDNKGQILAHILGVEETMRSDQDLPVNLHFVIEGEEEIGSPNLVKFLELNRERLRIGLVLVSDSEMLARGVPALAYGLRGLAALELKVTGPKVDLHSGLYGGVVANPIAALAQLLGTLCATIKVRKEEHKRTEAAASPRKF